MKKVYTFLFAVVLTATMIAQVPQKMSYQAVVRNSNGELVKSSPVGMKISILQGSTSGTVVYSETQTPTTNANGLITFEIGGGTPVTGTFSTIDWATGTYFIKSETDPAGGTNYTIIGTSQILSVPYALHANKAASYTETDPNAVLLTGNQTVDGDKTFTGATTVQPPVNANDAATKAYVDALETKINSLETAMINAGSHPSKFKDSRDGNIYNYVIIGNQAWMAENLAYLPIVHNNAEFQTQGNNSQPGYGVYGYDGSDIATAKSQGNYATFGVLYNWWAAMNGAGSSSSNPSGVQGVCPTGWHLPSDAEWTTLENYLIANGFNYDGTTIGNKYAKALASTYGWTVSSVTGAVGNTDYPGKRNATGFTALSGGGRSIDGTFGLFGNLGYWWSSTEAVATNAWLRPLTYNRSDVFRYNDSKKYGFNVRCIKD